MSATHTRRETISSASSSTVAVPVIIPVTVSCTVDNYYMTDNRQSRSELAIREEKRLAKELYDKRMERIRWRGMRYE
jgi:hypothetical protein